MHGGNAPPLLQDAAKLQQRVALERERRNRDYLQKQIRAAKVSPLHHTATRNARTDDVVSHDAVPAPPVHQLSKCSALTFNGPGQRLLNASD